MKHLRFCTLVLILTLTSACSVIVKMPSNRFDSPETMGKQWRVKLNSGLGGSSNIVLTDDYTKTAPNTTNPRIENGSSFYVGTGLAVDEAVDIEFRSNMLLQAKWQIEGAPRLTAEKDNFSMALTGGIGLISESAKGTGSDIFSGTTYAGEYTMKGTRLDAAFILGYRPLNWMMLYGGPFIHRVTFSGDRSTTQPTVTAMQFSGNGSHYGGNLGLEFGNNVFQAKVEGAYAKAKSGNGSQGYFYGGGEICFHIGKRSVK